MALNAHEKIRLQDKKDWAIAARYAAGDEKQWRKFMRKRA
jgi:hypothetical protein